MGMLIIVSLIALLLNLLLQLGAIAIGIRVAFRKLAHTPAKLPTQVYRLGTLVTVLFLGHLVQISVWAVLFLVLDDFKEINDFATAFYHSTVNYSTLGYGDIVMEDPWRLAGALEAAVGVMMFGVSTATLFSAVSHMFQTRFNNDEQK